MDIYIICLNPFCVEITITILLANNISKIVAHGNTNKCDIRSHGLVNNHE